MKIGRIVVATSDDLNKMYDAAVGILERIGMRVPHEITLDRLEAYGAKVSRADQTARMPAKVIDKAVAAVKKAALGRPLPKGEGPFDATFTASMGDGCFFLYDFEQKTRRKATKDDFITTVRFADAVPEITNFAAPVEIGGVPVETMVIEMLALSYLHSGKLSGVENNIPEQVKYLDELHKISKHYRGTGGVGGNAQGVTSPLTFGARAAALYIEGGKYGWNGGCYTMAIAGANAPASIEGCAIQAAAELLGAWTCLMALDENRHFGTLCLTGTTDMRTGKACWSSPGAIRQNCLVTTLFTEVLGVPMSTDWTWYTDAVAPGYQCAMDRMTKIMGMAPLFGSAGFHLGDLDGASVFSLEQAVLDLDVCRAAFELYKPARFDDEMMALAEIKRIGLDHGKTHLETDFTLEHFRDTLWMPRVIPHTYWKEGPGGAATEADVLADAYVRWKGIVAEHAPYSPPPGMARDVEKVLARARAEL